MNYEKNAATTIFENATTNDVVKLIDAVSSEATNDPLMQSLSRALVNQGGDPLKNIFQFACKVARYQPDAPTLQTVRTPARLIMERRGNCVDFSVLISTILKCLKFGHKYKIVKLAPNMPYGHIYIVSNLVNGTKVLDPIYGKDYKKDENNILIYFNKEVPHTNFKLYESTSA